MTGNNLGVVNSRSAVLPSSTRKLVKHYSGGATASKPQFEAE
jgi:hypothetical protein